MDITKRFNRVVAIYFQLQAKPIVKAQDLAAQFDVSKRTIYRDIRSLEQAGIPIYGEAGSGYALVDGYKLSPTRFTQEEIMTLAAAEKLMNKFVDPHLAKHFGSAINKIKAYLRSDEKSDISILEENMMMSVMENRFNKNVPSALSQLFESVAQQKIVNMHYQSSSANEVTQREIEPVGLFHQGSFWYFMAYCHLREDYRQFRIDRVQQLDLTNRGFTRKHKKLSYYLNKDEAPPTTQIRLSIARDFARYIQWERSYYGFVSETVKGDEVEMTFESKNAEEEFARWYLMFADQATILEPLSLRTTVRDLLTRIKVE
ncbi:helix-turn-helix transcriptional regulator [Albibacterium profundi]|uniref:YafY family protein n=1 Tax=Albibacterium profundi TaxID=3134906 RepID=A0ABV5CGK1_9SPHI